jgi:hypothetical protein
VVIISGLLQVSGAFSGLSLPPGLHFINQLTEVAGKAIHYFKNALAQE